MTQVMREHGAGVPRLVRLGTTSEDESRGAGWQTFRLRRLRGE